MASEIEVFETDRSRWEPSKIRTADNTLEAWKMLITGLSNNTIEDTYIEATARLLIGMMMTTQPPEEYEKVMNSYQSEYDKEFAMLNIGDKEKKEKAASTRAWLNLLNKATRYFGKFVKSEGNEMCFAVIRPEQHDRQGREIILIDEQDIEAYNIRYENYCVVNYLGVSHEVYDKIAPDVKKKTLNLSRYIARKITSENIDVTIVIVGSKGKGKSWFALSLAEGIAKELSIIFYKNESKWREYWNYKEDTAIIDDDWIQRVLLKNTPRHHIKVLDDVGYSKGVDSRKWHSKENDKANKMVSINRTKNGVAIYTSQSHLFIDKKMRQLLNIYIEVTGPKDEERGINRAQLNRMTLHPRDESDPIHYPFFYGTDPDDKHTIAYPIIGSGVCEKEVVEWYEPARAAELDKEIKKSTEKPEEEEKPAMKKGEETEFKVSTALILDPEAPAWKIAKQIGKSESSVRMTNAWRNRVKSSASAIV